MVGPAGSRLFIGGSRHLAGAAAAAQVGQLAALAAAAGAQVVTGCAAGADAMARGACPAARVFRVVGARTPAALAQRTAAGVGFTAGAPGSVCCVLFAGSVSPGSLLTCRLAARHGLALFVWGLPAALLPRLGGSWAPVSGWPGWWHRQPPGARASLSPPAAPAAQLSLW